MSVDRLMESYFAAETIDEAEQALDRLADEGVVARSQLGDCYDDLADAAAQEEDFDAAARLERRAMELGCRDGTLARQMLAWYLLSAGRTGEGEALFAELQRERPADASLLVALGHARSGAGLEGAALAAFDDAVTVAKTAGDDRMLDRARIERRAEREHLGLSADEDDRLAPPPRPLPSDTVEWAVAWFPPDERAEALVRWPGLADDFADPVAYSRRVETHLADLRDASGRRPTVAVLHVEELVAWSHAQGYDSDTGEARSRFAAELSRAGRALEWPPGRNEPCWCRSGRKYKRCCGGR